MERVVYAGIWAKTYNGSDGGGIEVLCCKEGQWKRLQKVETGKSVSFLTADKERRLLFAVCETNYHGKNEPGGEIRVYWIEKSGMLKQADVCNSFGGFPIAIHLEREWAVVLNHGSNLGKICVTYREDNGEIQSAFISDEANLALFQREKDGRLGKLLDRYIFRGQGDIRGFQDSPSPHSLYASYKEPLFYVPERGTDIISVLRAENGGKSGLAPTGIKKENQMEPAKGTGPRNGVEKGGFHYILSEIEPLIIVFKEEKGKYKRIQEISTVPEEAKTGMDKESFDYPHPAGICVHPLGKYLYTITRKVDAVTVFEILPGSGELKYRTIFKLAGKNPRQISCRGDNLEIVCMDSGSILRVQLDRGIPVFQKEIISGIPRIAVLHYGIE